jgi:hypothetical protein
VGVRAAGELGSAGAGRRCWINLGWKRVATEDRPIARSLTNLVLTAVGSAVKSLRRHAPRVVREREQGLPRDRGTVDMCSLSVRDGIPPLGGREVWTSPIRSDSIHFDRAIGRSRYQRSVIAVDVFVILIVRAASEPVRSSPRLSVATVRRDSYFSVEGGLGWSRRGPT